MIEYLVENPDAFKVLNSNSVADPFTNLVDTFILDEIQSSGIDTPILVTNDRIFQLQARLRGIKSEIYKESVPFKSEAEYFTGFVASRAEAVPNAFMWNEQGKPVFFGIEIGQKLGYLPGKLEEKMEPYARYIADLAAKLHRLRPANKIFIDSDVYPPQFNPKNLEILPLAYIRGMNIENAVVIIDEMQNMSRSECRALLTRMGVGLQAFLDTLMDILFQLCV